MSPVYVIVGIYKNINYIFLETIELYSFHRVLHLLGFVSPVLLHIVCVCVSLQRKMSFQWLTPPSQSKTSKESCAELSG